MIELLQNILKWEGEQPDVVDHVGTVTTGRASFKELELKKKNFNRSDIWMIEFHECRHVG